MHACTHAHPHALTTTEKAREKVCKEADGEEHRKRRETGSSEGTTS